MKIWDVVCIILHVSMKEIFGEPNATTNIVDSSSGIMVCEEISFDEATDGNNLTSAVFELPCDLSSVPLLIRLQPSNKLGSISLFAGEDTNGAANYLDYFVVSLNLANKTSYSCGSWTEPFRVGRSIKVNCPLYGFVFDTVTIATDKGVFGVEKRFVRISEIEVQTHEYSESTAFYGCYEIFEGKTFGQGTRNSCKDLCYEERNYFVSYRSDGSCLCGSNVPKSILPSENCLPRCDVEDVLCGGPKAYAVYVARAPHIFSIGCYHSEMSRDVGVDDDDDVTPGRCIVKCARLHKPFVYLFGSKHCVCDDINLYQLNNMTLMSECNLRCSDGHKNCGGKDTTLVYTGCLSDTGETSCVDVYKCKDDNFDEFGVCQGPCDDGFKGSYCLERERTTNVNTLRGNGHIQPSPANRLPTASTAAEHAGNTISTTVGQDRNTTTNETQGRVLHNVEALVFYKRDSVSVSLIVIFLVTLALALIAIIFAALYFKEPEVVREVSD